MKKHTGFTLIELLITLVIAAVLLAVGIPSFKTLFENNRLVTQANELVGTVNLARSEAVKRGANVTIQASAGGFQNGWCVHLGADCTGTNVLKLFPALNQMAVASGGVATFVFNGRGQKATPAGEVTIQLSPANCVSGTVDGARSISIANTGRASVARGNCP